MKGLFLLNLVQVYSLNDVLNNKDIDGKDFK